MDYKHLKKTYNPHHYQLLLDEIEEAKADKSEVFKKAKVKCILPLGS
jgi:hypothetical protein